MTGGGVGAGVGGAKDSVRGTFGGIGSGRKDLGGGPARLDSGDFGGNEGGEETLSSRSFVLLIVNIVKWDDIPLRYRWILPLQLCSRNFRRQLTHLRPSTNKFNPLHLFQ